MASGKPDFRWAAKIWTSIAFCLIGAVAGTSLYVGNLVFVKVRDDAATAASILRVFDGQPIEPWTGFVSSQENWAGTRFTSKGASQGPISATVDSGGMRVVWNGSAAQVYLQSVTTQKDLTSYVRTGALVFDVTVHKPPADRTTVGIHCVYPCSAEVPVTTLLRQLRPETKSTVKIPLSCFVANGLDPKQVDTPFLVYTEGPFDATFSDVRWVPGAATDSDVTPCSRLH
jgi:molecular chaperone DnaK